MPNCAHNSPIVRSSCSYSNTKRSFSSITLLVFQGIMTVVTPLPFVAVSEMPPVYFVRHPPGLYQTEKAPTPPPLLSHTNEIKHVTYKMTNFTPRNKALTHVALSSFILPQTAKAPPGGSAFAVCG